MANRTKPAAKQRARSETAGQAQRFSATKDGGVPGANRKERKEEARRQREALQRKIARRRYYRIGAAVVAALVAIGLVLGFTVFRPKKGFDQADLAGLMTGTNTADWTSNTEDLATRIQQLGLPPLTASEQLAFHIHQELHIYIDGKQVTVPAYIGIDNVGQKIAVIHVHATDGVIHVESPIQKTFTLGDFFGVWGLSFTPTSIGGYESGDGKTLQVFLNGKPYSGDPTELGLKNHEVIVVAFGTSQQLPSPVPSTVDWANTTAGG